MKCNNGTFHRVGIMDGHNTCHKIFNSTMEHFGQSDSAHRCTHTPNNGEFRPPNAKIGPKITPNVDIMQITSQFEPFDHAK